MIGPDEGQTRSTMRPLATNYFAAASSSSTCAVRTASLRPSWSSCWLPLRRPQRATRLLRPRWRCRPPLGAPPEATPSVHAFAAESSARIRVAAIDTTRQVSFGFTSEGIATLPVVGGRNHVSNLSIRGNVGEAYIDGRAVPLFSYVRIPWPDFGLVLFQVLAIESDRWHVLWLYCDGPDLTNIYYQDTLDHEVTYQGMSGICVDVPLSPTLTHIQFPATDMAYPPLEGGYTMTGPALAYDGQGPGSIVIGGRTLILLPFNDVDCRMCGGPGWWELHSIAWDPERSQATFLILYLQTQDPGHVSASYGITAPSLASLGYLSFSASWTVP